MPFLELRQLLKNRNFLFLWLEQILTQFSYNLMNFSLIVSVFKLTGSNFSVGILLLCFFLPSSIFTNVAGLISDYFHRKKIMMLANIVWASLVLSFILARNTFWAICLVAILIQIADEFFVNANFSAIPSVVDPKNLLLANSLFSLTNYLCLILGTLSVGILIRMFSPVSPFIVASSLVFLGSFFVSKLNFQQKLILPQKRKVMFEHITNDLKKGWEFIKSQRSIKILVAFLVSLNALQAFFLAISPGYLENVLRIRGEDASFVFILPLGIGLLLAGTFLGKFGKKYRKISFIQKGLFLLGLAFLFLALIPKSTRIAKLTKKTWPFEAFLGVSAPLILMAIVLGFGGALVFVPSQTLFQEKIPEELRGRVLSTLHFSGYLASSALTLLSGFLADNIGFFPLFLSLSIFGLFLGIFSQRILVGAKVLEK